VFNARHSVRHLGETCAAYEDEYTAAYLVCRNSGGRARVIRGDANALVTLVAQSSIDRLDRVERMLVSWPGENRFSCNMQMAYLVFTIFCDFETASAVDGASVQMLVAVFRSCILGTICGRH
jgi:hypothetical protein